MANEGGSKNWRDSQQPPGSPLRCQKWPNTFVKLTGSKELTIKKQRLLLDVRAGFRLIAFAYNIQKLS